jgi:small subunit ribosomal protein S18
VPRNGRVLRKSPDRKPRTTAASGRPRRGRPKVCLFCRQHANWVDYKDVSLLGRFVNDRGRIKARSATGTCAQHQRDVAVAIKTARELALLPYAVRTQAKESRGGRGDRGRGPRPGAAAQAESEDSESVAGTADGDVDASDDVADNSIAANV